MTKFAIKGTTSAPGVAVKKAPLAEVRKSLGVEAMKALSTPKMRRPQFGA